MNPAIITVFKIKVQLASMFRKEIDKRQLNQTQAAQLLGVPQSRISEIKNAKLDRVSVDDLIYYLGLLEIPVNLEFKNDGDTFSMHLTFTEKKPEND